MNTVSQLIERFRIDVDDIKYDPADETDLLFTDADIEYYFVESQRRFVAETFYLHGTIREKVVANSPIVRLSDRVLEFRNRHAYLETLGVSLEERNYGELINHVGDDYGMQVTTSPFDRQTGRPRFFSADIENDRIDLFPTPEADDIFVAEVYLEAPCTPTLVIDNPRHVNMLLNGMKALAYAKQDADAYDPRQAARWEEKFAYDIFQVGAERQRRRRKPGIVAYGGI